jgi:predicted Rdx family selenoprotein
MSDTAKPSDKDQVRALLDRLPDDATFADIQRAIAVLVWPKRDDGSLAPPKRLEPDEVKRRLRDWLKSERDK